MGDSAYGSAEMLGWLVYEHGIEPHVTVFDKSARQDDIFSRENFAYGHAGRADAPARNVRFSPEADIRLRNWNVGSGPTAYSRRKPRSLQVVPESINASVDCAGRNALVSFQIKVGRYR
jgi:hypothetical protein